MEYIHRAESSREYLPNLSGISGHQGPVLTRALCADPVIRGAGQDAEIHQGVYVSLIQSIVFQIGLGVDMVELFLVAFSEGRAQRNRSTAKEIQRTLRCKHQYKCFRVYVADVKRIRGEKIIFNLTWKVTQASREALL